MNKKIFSNKYFWWGLGLIIVLIATSVEVFRGRNTNYFDYQDSTRMFWEGLSPYNWNMHRHIRSTFSTHQCSASSLLQSSTCRGGWDLTYGTSATIPCSPLPSNGYHNNSRNINFISLYSCCQ